MELKADNDDRENNFPSVKADAEEKKVMHITLFNITLQFYKLFSLIIIVR